MARHIAFLRAINVGGRNVTMEALRREFAALGFSDVETFIASGNVIFTARSRDAAALERKIERHLESRLGYEVATFIRTPDDVASIARYEPFPRVEMRAAAALNVGFLAAPLAPSARARLLAMATDIDTFHLRGREIYWMCRRRQSESKITNVILQRELEVRSTFRGMNTIVRLAAKLA